MRGLIVYRIITILVNIFAFFIGLSLLFGLMMLFSNPGLAFGFFLMLGVILYVWYANKFLRTVLIAQQPFTKKQKDWLQVNAIVALVFSMLLVTQSVAIIRDPSRFAEALQQMPVKYPESLIVNISSVILAFALALLIHITWTYLLVRQNKDMIEP